MHGGGKDTDGIILIMRHHVTVISYPGKNASRFQCCPKQHYHTSLPTRTLYDHYLLHACAHTCVFMCTVMLNSFHHVASLSLVPYHFQQQSFHLLLCFFLPDFCFFTLFCCNLIFFSKGTFTLLHGCNYFTLCLWLGSLCVFCLAMCGVMVSTSAFEASAYHYC